MNSVRLEFTSDPRAFLAGAGDWLSADPVRSTIVSTWAEREMAERAEGIAAPSDRPYWYLTVHGADGAVAGVGMRTAEFAPHPVFVLNLPDDAGVALARALHDRGERVGGVNGFRPTVDEVAEEYVRLAGGRIEVAEHVRLFELGELVPPAGVPGRLRAAQPDEIDQAVRWYDAFATDSAEQAGRAGPHGLERHSPDDMRRRIDQGRVWFWVDEDGRPVHVTGANLPAYGVARIGPVYTPPELRGRGFASAAVAGVSRLLLERGARVCLYADQANAVSTKIYQRLGFRPVADQAHLVITVREKP